MQKSEKRGRGQGRTTRQDWIDTALQILVAKGEESVKVLNLAEALGTTRSSFYWFFKNRRELLDCLLDYWQKTNTRAVVQGAAVEAGSINLAIVNINRIWLAEEGFDTALDFAVRDWARRSELVRKAVEITDSARLDALSAMFQRHDYSPDESEVRARIFYYTQIGYETTMARETLEERFSRAKNYMFCLSGQVPTDDEMQAIMSVRSRIEKGGARRV
ncbi:TetR/AcrR family transcriptional regulator [uncultured Roseovarius sp.]|uniref:TetR/AcrR family transcriptional regulator n=1 Tax=uncultured Roseovarius sp. TaxID=293344 RepID=UPI00260BD3C5|nr:TetR/AcrR family transcriptional regulator [uncultured Roseovarius sp.]